MPGASRGGPAGNQGNASSRCGISTKGIDSSSTAISAVCRPSWRSPGRWSWRSASGEALGNSIYEARSSSSWLGEEPRRRLAIDEKMKPKHLERLRDLLERAGVTGETGGVHALRLVSHALHLQHRQRRAYRGQSP